MITEHSREADSWSSIRHRLLSRSARPLFSPLDTCRRRWCVLVCYESAYVCYTCEKSFQDRRFLTYYIRKSLWNIHRKHEGNFKLDNKIDECVVVVLNFINMRIVIKFLSHQRWFLPHLPSFPVLAHTHLILSVIFLTYQQNTELK